MATVTLKGNPIQTIGELPAVGSQAPDFQLTNAALEDVGLDAFQGKKKILNIVPSLDTDVCATSARTFNERAAGKQNAVVLVISGDLPFAQKRFCTAEGIDGVVTLSLLRGKNFAKDYGVLITDGPLAGLCSRAVIVLDENNRVTYTEQVPEIVQEPDYDKALAAI